MNKYRKAAIIFLLPALFIQCLFAPCGKQNEALAASTYILYTEPDDVISSRDTIELCDNASGVIDVDWEMPDLIFTPEEDGAWILHIRSTPFDPEEGADLKTEYYFYEKLPDGNWQRIDSYYTFDGIPDTSSPDSVIRVQDVPQYYQKGHTYRIRFVTSRSGGTASLQYSYHFQKTNLAGCTDGLVWRIDDVHSTPSYTEMQSVCATRYVGEEKILSIPSEAGGFPLFHLGSPKGFYAPSVQTLIVGKSIRSISDLRDFTQLTDLYLYNETYDPTYLQLPMAYDKLTGVEYCAVILHSYSGSPVEEWCKKNNYSFEALPETVTPSPSPDAPVLSAAPSLLPTETPQSPSQTESPAAPSPTISLTPSPAASPSPPPTNSPSPSPAPFPTRFRTSSPAFSPSLTETPPTPSSSVSAIVPSASAPIATVPIASAPAAEENTSTDRTAESAPSRISGFRAATDHYTYVRLTWKSLPGCTYSVFRSAKKSSVGKMLKNVRGRTSYRDNTVQSGKCYYYQIRAFQTKNDTKSIHAVSKILQVRVCTLSAPVIKIQKKQSGSVRYLILKLRKYEGKKLEVYYKKSKWASYQKIALYTNDIKRQKGIFRLQYLSSEGQLYLRVRTFERKNGKKIYSKYAKEVKIKT